MDAVAAMNTWVGALSRGGLLFSHDEVRGAEQALAVLGEATLSELRGWFARQPPEVVARERRGAIHACIWMAHADREVKPEELAVLEAIIVQSGLEPEVQDELTGALAAPRAPAEVARDLTQPGLRELVLGLAIQLAHTDDVVDAHEERAYRALADAFGIDDARAEEIRVGVAALSSSGG